MKINMANNKLKARGLSPHNISISSDSSDMSLVSDDSYFKIKSKSEKPIEENERKINACKHVLDEEIGDFVFLSRQ